MPAERHLRRHLRKPLETQSKLPTYAERLEEHRHRMERLATRVEEAERVLEPGTPVVAAGRRRLQRLFTMCIEDPEKKTLIEEEGAVGPTTTDRQAPPTEDGIAAKKQELEARSLEELRELLGNRPCVCVAGGCASDGPDLQDLIREIAARLQVRPGARAAFLTSASEPGGVQEQFAKLCSDATVLWNLVASGQPSSLCGRDVVAGDNSGALRDILLQLVDVYVAVGGGAETAEEARLLLERGARVVPVARAGGASAGAFGFPEEALARPAAVQPEIWALLARADVPCAESALALAEVVDGILVT